MSAIHHFHLKDIITVDRILRADNNFTERIRARPKLCQNAVSSMSELKDEELFAQALKLSNEQQAHDTEKNGVQNLSNILTHISSIYL